MRKVLYVMGILNDEDVEWLAHSGTSKFLRPDTVLISEGVAVDAIYIILEGQLSVVSQRLKREISSLSCGEMLGEISFVDSRLPSAAVIAVRDSYVLEVRRDLLKEKLEGDPGFASRFYRAVATLLADRLRTTVGQLGYDMVKSTPEADDLDDDWMENISFAASRFDTLLRKLGAAQATA